MANKASRVSEETRIENATVVLNSCRAYFSAGWYLQVSENVDADRDGTEENLISFRHTVYGTLSVQIDPGKSIYNPLLQSAEFWGTGTFRGKRVVAKAVVSAIGGYYQRGTTRLWCWEDKNNDADVDFLEPQIFPSSSPLSNQMTLMTFAPKGE
jgi:hypothetical protein